MKKDDFFNLINQVKAKRDELRLKMHLASMETKDEFDEAEKKWAHLVAKVSQISDETVETTEGVISKTKVIGEELNETYHRIAKRLSE